MPSGAGSGSREDTWPGPLFDCLADFFEDIGVKRPEDLKVAMLQEKHLHLHEVIEKVNNILFDIGGEVSDVEHVIQCHPEDVPDLLRRVAKGVLAAQEVVSEVVWEKLEKS